MNSEKTVAKAIPVFASSGPEAATLEALETANSQELKVACNEFLFKWVPPGMTIAEFEQVSCGLYARIYEEWDKRNQIVKED